MIDALGWKRNLGGRLVQPPDARLSRGLEVHPAGTGDDLELWIDKRVIRAGYGWSFPARDELRVGIGSFEPRDHVKEPTVRLADDLGLPPDGYQGNWIPHRLRPATQDGIFFVGDSAGHCLPLTAEGIRTAFYFGIAARARAARGARGPARPRRGAARATTPSPPRTAGSTSACSRPSTRSRRLRPRALRGMARTFTHGAPAHWAFRHYLRIAPPEYALPAPPAAARAPRRARRRPA